MSVHRLRKIDGPNNTPVKEKVDQILMMENIVESENSGTNIIEEVKRKRGRPRKLVKKVYVKTGKKRGRPSSYNYKIASRIFNQLARGRSITEICGDEKMPSLKTVFNWLDEKHPSYQEGFSSSYKTGKMLQLHLLYDKIRQVVDADYKIIVTKKITDRKGNVTIKKMERSSVPWRRLQFQYLKWRVSHLQPRKYAPDFF